MTGQAENGSGYVVGGLLVIEAGRHGPRDRLLRTAVAALGELSGEAFVPEGRLDIAFLAGDRSATSVSLTHPRFPILDDDAISWLSLAVDTYEPEPWEAIFVGIHIGDSVEHLAVEWEVGLAVMPRLVLALSPALAFMNAWSLDTDSEVLPSGTPVPGRAIPSLFTAWTYVGPPLRDDERRSLAHLPAVESTPLGEGWLVRAVDHVSDVPNRDFLTALEHLGEPGASYQPPKLATRRSSRKRSTR